ncbi:MAG TPA: hypothetical protein DDZ89_07575 [Clostridiales bacterium]|nr:hypothetical protein [Clostridiales bacterium]
MKNEKRGNKILVIFLAFLYAVVTTGALAITLLIPVDYLTIMPVCFITILLLTVMSINKKSFWLTFVLAIIAVITFTVIVNRGGRVYVVQQTMYDYGKWIWQSLTSLRRDTETFLNISAVLISIAVSLVCYILIIRKIRMIPLLILTLPVYIIPFLNQQVIGFVPMLVAVIVLLLLFALMVFRKQGQSYLKDENKNLELKYLAFVVPLVIIIGLGAFGLTRVPRQDRSSRMNNIVRNIEKKLEEWNIVKDKQFEFGGEFNLQTSGYQPGGTLGGNVTEKDGLSMIVESEIPLYLKGSIQDRYLGNTWRPGLRRATTLRSTNIGNYVTDATFSERRVFNEAMKALNFRLDRADYDSFFKEGEVEITHYGLKTNTLFYPHNMIYVELAKQNDSRVRINNNNELYFPFNVVQNTNYTVKYRYFDMSNPASEYLLQQLDKNLLDEWLEQEENAPIKEKYDYIYDRYTETEYITDQVRDFAQRIVESTNAQNRYDMAKAIETHLRENYIYTLSPGNVPASEDFVEYFLFKGKGGYCTYYASAMTVMLRSLGIPARYIEGFATIDENRIGKIYSILQKNSHAWVEVFFEGVGWVTFEPTSSIVGEVVPGEGSGTGEGPVDVPDDEEIWDWQGGSPEEYFELPDTESWEDMFGDDYDRPDTVKIPWKEILLYVILPLLVLLYPIKIILTKLKLLVDRKKSPNRSITLYYNRVLKLLEMAGMGIRQGETLYELADRKHIVIKSVNKELKKATEAFYSIRFADMKRNTKDFNNMYYVYKKMNENIKFYLGPWKFFVRRYIKGFKIW